MSSEKFVIPILASVPLRSNFSALKRVGRRSFRSTTGLIVSRRADTGVRRLSRIWQSPSLPMKSARLGTIAAIV